MKFYSSSLELSTLQTHIIVYRLGCRSKISIRTFFRIWILSIQIDFIAVFRFERLHTMGTYSQVVSTLYDDYTYNCSHHQHP